MSQSNCWMFIWIRQIQDGRHLSPFLSSVFTGMNDVLYKLFMCTDIGCVKCSSKSWLTGQVLSCCCSNTERCLDGKSHALQPSRHWGEIVPANDSLKASLLFNSWWKLDNISGKCGAPWTSSLPGLTKASSFTSNIQPPQLLHLQGALHYRPPKPSLNSKMLGCPDNETLVD